MNPAIAMPYRQHWILAIALCVPIAAYAGATLAEAAGTWRFWAAFGAVQVLCLFGYAGSSLPEWAQWLDETGGAVAVAERRLKILQRTVVSFLAGNAAYFIGAYGPEAMRLPEIPCFVGAAVAAWGGDKFLSPLLARITGKAPG